MVAEQVEHQLAIERKTIDVRVDKDALVKALQLLKTNEQWLQQKEDRLLLMQKNSSFLREQLQRWLNWSFQNLHRASNGTTFFYLIWTPLVIFWSVIITWGVPTKLACPKPDGICHNTRMAALEAKKVMLLPSIIVSKFTGK